MTLTRDDRILILVGLMALAFLLRWFLLDSVPPGWRDDELINSLVISQKALDGDLAVYYADASGHEALYHLLNAIFLGLFGPGVAGIRLLSVILGTLTVPMTYLMGRKLFNGGVGLAAALGLAFSFWSLMYSRIGLRHILMPLLTLAAFYFFWRGMETNVLRFKINDLRLMIERPIVNRQSSIVNYLLSALFISLGFYTYFAGRGVPLILAAFGGYLFLVDRERFKRHWRGWVVMLGVTAVLALPLLYTLNQQPESEARVAELAAPLVEAGAGNFQPLWKHIRITLSMFHSDGDDEWLYNIPHRPVFGSIGAIFFWMGVAIAFWRALQPFFRTRSYAEGQRHAESRREKTASSNFSANFMEIQPNLRPSAPFRVPLSSFASAFLLFWWLAGISPGFISVPPASLGHTILAQPAVFLLAALPIGAVYDLRFTIYDNLQPLIVIFLTAVFTFSVAIRDLPDYFVEWPQRGMTRFLYRADIQELTEFLNTNPKADVGIAGLLAGPWDKLAFDIGLEDDKQVAARWFNPERAILLEPAISFTSYPGLAETYADWYEPVIHPKWGLVKAGSYALNEVVRDVEMEEPVCFVNGLCWVTAVYHPDAYILELGWQVGRKLELPDMPLISNPPPPGVYAGSRLRVFGQLWDADGNFLKGDDGLWVDPITLRPGDIFVQRHWLSPPDGVGGETAVFGLYDPMTGERILTEDGRDHLRLEIGD
ncbi:MAG: phospholipid carrier-dependent glycosyltransferase [Chloroflexi bacterium]|nr:phospholipid carrier-dependent glycosyltransferase [Chloroflexota bacterium]